MTTLVLDASAGVELLLSTSAARRLASRLPLAPEWWVPEHYFIEVGAALRRADIHQLVGSERVAVAFDRLQRSTVHRVQARPLLAAAWRWRERLTIADATYVALALQLGAALVTTDARLARAASVPTLP